VFGKTQGAHPPEKPGKVGEFDIGRGKVSEIRRSQGKDGKIVVFLWCATVVLIVRKLT